MRDIIGFMHLKFIMNFEAGAGCLLMSLGMQITESPFGAVTSSWASVLVTSLSLNPCGCYSIGMGSCSVN
jgi:hypothetical protein